MGRNDWSEGDAYEVEVVNYHWEVTTVRRIVLKPIHPGKILIPCEVITCP